MQTSVSRPGATPQTARKLKLPGSDSTSAPSPNPITKTPKDRSPKTNGDRRVPRTPPTEKKRPNKAFESEPRISQLQEELKKTKEQLTSTESWKRRAQHEAEEAKKQLAAMSIELELSRNELKELSESEEERVQELRKISQERDRAWESELEAFQKQYSMDSAALGSAMNEIQKLKMQLDRVSQSEASQARHAESAHAEIQSLRVELTETLVLVDRLKNQLNESREYEARAMEEVTRAQLELEVVKNAEKDMKLELKKSNDRVKSLEGLVASLRNDLDPSVEVEASTENGESETLKTESTQNEAELEAKLKRSIAQVEELRTKVTETEKAMQMNSESELEDLKALLLSITEENEALKREMTKTKTDKTKASDAENKALMRVDSLTEEADMNSKKVIRVTEQLDAAQASNSELESELRRLKVQCDQWRKAAEAAAAMLSTGNTEKYGERKGSFDYHSISKKLGSPHSEDTDDESPKKKNGNMLKKIGVLLKKGQK